MIANRLHTNASAGEPAAAAPPARSRRAALTASASAQPAMQASTQAAIAPSVEQLQRAATDPSTRLPDDVAVPLAQRIGADFAGVRVHRGEGSHQAAESLGARAYTLGRHIYLNRLADRLSAADRSALLTHEAVHSAQQGGGDVSPHADLELGRPGDASEAEAEGIAAELQGSPSLALRDRMHALPLTQRHGPRLQPDLKGPYKSTDGDFDLNLKTESHKGAKSGMSGTIEFTPSATAPDSKSIRLMQVVKTSIVATGKDNVYTGDEANRNKVMTAEDKTSGTEGGYFVDAVHKNRTPRTAKADAPVSPYYIDDYLALKSPRNRDGSKQGSTIASASLYDYPGADGEVDFKFETAAKDSGSGYVYATLTWGFRISDAAKGTVSGEYAKANYVQSPTFNAALKQFDEFYKNAGAASAPTK